MDAYLVSNRMARNALIRDHRARPENHFLRRERVGALRRRSSSPAPRKARATHTHRYHLLDIHLDERRRNRSRRIHHRVSRRRYDVVVQPLEAAATGVSEHIPRQFRSVPEIIRSQVKSRQDVRGVAAQVEFDSKL
jgi:hypothetical protein